ncbi:MAG TPA: carotenoid biosynthesis protein [Cytophagaceae bacterium]|jgi:putative membrane protein|nr:carotenoid biosynthesis protein [Cytophagaceae bacterium]
MRFDSQFIKEKLKSYEFSIFIILLFHVSGLIGLQTSSRDWFLALTPLNLLVSFIAMFRHENYRNLTLLSFTMLIFLLGFLVEVAGVNTGLVFGAYRYGPVLGLKFFNTPLMIGVNWFVMVFCIGVVVEKTKFPTVVKALLGAGIMVVSDYIIEPVAIAYDFWTWSDAVVPFQNYAAWYLFSFLFLLIFYRFDIEKNNKVAPWLLCTQIVFFLTLNLLL